MSVSVRVCMCVGECVKCGVPHTKRVCGVQDNNRQLLTGRVQRVRRGIGAGLRAAISV